MAGWLARIVFMLDRFGSSTDNGSIQKIPNQGPLYAEGYEFLSPALHSGSSEQNKEKLSSRPTFLMNESNLFCFVRLL